ncbi:MULTISPECIES: ATP-binding cassette domain-containing protein [unclassified Rothia (in: high G+C Gram-positive bacteria)]|uniref:ABC transporter ATP-binding protein/permease n=1 Tax=unclassified Rothia (in: high G+C Gram-positive bacteria) TaxID=2689056 RepID=UPI0008A19924|nr:MULTISPECIES: ATP-binding cassette domain-containing protein [unclassified Rothia (in: high G+C Gram-positive bacteria)]OFR47260.1 macrolide ABC transporter ATP-binding protein [Rothia sp. HMSC073B08]OHQ16524.1 macrolide ABC transporter ATP-binding protein [Rothia sp. HMSC064F07]
MSRRKITPDTSPERAPTVAPNVASAATPAAGLGTAPAIEMHGITRIFEGSERAVLDHLDLVVERGEFLAIIGPSGSGKSTLLNAIGLLDTPTSGTYSLFGKNTEGLSDRERDEMRRDHLGFIFQSSNMLLDETSTTNASMGLRVQGVPYSERLQRTEETLEFLGLSDRASIRTRYLSGGEKQRCAIARALATRPPLILADEPTGNLDSHNSAKVIEILQRINATGCTVLVITHDPEVAAAARRVIRIEDGRLHEQSRADLATVPVAEAVPAATDTPAEATVGAPVDASASLAPGEKPATHRRGSFLTDDSIEAISALTSRPLRTLLLGLSFALGVGGLISASGMSESASYQVNQRLLGSEQSTLYISDRDNDQNMLGTYRQGESAQNVADRISALDYVKNTGFVSSVAPADVRITRFSPYEDEPKTAIGLSSTSKTRLEQIGARMNPETLRALEQMNSTLTQQNVADRERSEQLSGAIVSVSAARALGILPEDKAADNATTEPRPGELPAVDYGIKLGGLPQVAPGVSIWVDGQLMPVVGLFDPGNSGYEFRNTVIVSPGTLQRTGRGQVTYIAETERGYGKAVAKAIPLTLKPAEPSQINVETPSDLQSLRASIASDLGLYVGVLSGILLVLASLSAATAMYLSVQSRTAEIALRRAIGSSKWLIARIFLMEGVMLGVLGGSIGACSGMIATIILSLVQGWQAVLSPGFVVLGVGVGALTGLVSSAYPAWVASRKSPADAMRG